MANRITFTSRSLNLGDNITIKNNGNISRPNIGATTVANTPIVQPAEVVKPEVKVNTPPKTASANPLIISNAGILNVLNISAATWTKELPKEDPEEKWLSQFVPQDKLNMPISPAQTAAENLLFEDPNNSAIKYFLPKYRVAEQITTSGRQRRIKLEQLSTDPNLAGKLTVFLERYPHDSIKNQVINAKVINHEVQVTLSFLASGGLTNNLAFHEITELQDGTLKAVLNIASMDEKDQIFLALSTENYNARLSITKKIWVAYPVFTQLNANDLNTDTHKPILRFTGLEDYQAGGKTFTRAKLSIINRAIYPDALFSPAPDLPPCGENKNASRTWVNIYSGEGKRIYGFCALNKNDQLENLWFAFPKGAPSSNVCYVELLDRRTPKSFVSKKVAITGNPASGKPLYRVSNETFEDKLSFFFPLATNPNIYQGIVSSGPSQQTGFNPFFVEWNNVKHFYLQDQANPNRFLYLPDSFKLARAEGIKNLPLMSIDYKKKDEASETKVDFSFALKGYFNMKRLQDASTKLLAKINDASVKELEFTSLYLDASKLTCTLFLLDSNSNIATQERTNAIIDLNQSTVEDVITDLSLDHFQKAFLAVLGTGQTGKMLTGHVKVDLPNISIPTIPVSVRLEDASGELFHISTQFVPNSTTVQITLQNATESTVEIKKINNIDIQNENQRLKGTPQGLTLPIQVQPFEILTITVTTDKPLVTDPSLDVMFDWDLDIKLDTPEDQTKVYDAVVNPTIFSTYNQQIEVTKYANSIPENSTISRLTIDFKNQQTGGVIKSISFNNDRQDAAQLIKLPLSMRDFVLNLPTSGQYWYQVIAVTAQGEMKSDWRNDTFNLDITADKIPTAENQI